VPIAKGLIPDKEVNKLVKKLQPIIIKANFAGQVLKRIDLGIGSIKRKERII